MWQETSGDIMKLERICCSLLHIIDVKITLLHVSCESFSFRVGSNLLGVGPWDRSLIVAKRGSPLQSVQNETR